ncbi:MAG: hypothetical protein A2X56_10140 [Nitrospirae bacterium GWC2_57_13]|jgi:hypothetical protein|nr:MAG: hypothetical protein A2072_07600 [Nitrospirae bacterium GWC1_57_7]OGW26731.1 MAG: hypothetical protein A2X56_10140 [Nitrospirae bacterium GWC2_57_13]OGW46514.1 MAG: hypothetical protein A2X57_01855 [Nitrospirae bacterium GWD2_57_8]HAS53921.1 hypothetical protein [Nitrospiraceae bacterium]
MNATRMVFLSAALVTLLGMALTGFAQVHWVLYVPVIMFIIAGITGICPGVIIWTKLGFKNEPMSCDQPFKKKYAAVSTAGQEVFSQRR